MKGQFFAHVSVDPQNSNRRLVRRGQVIGPVGDKHHLLSFIGKGFRFSNVLATEQLTEFAFFDTMQDLNAWVEDLFPPPPPPPAPKAPADVPPPAPKAPDATPPESPSVPDGNVPA